jgi:hypothetical protein
LETAENENSLFPAIEEPLGAAGPPEA